MEDLRNNRIRQQSLDTDEFILLLHALSCFLPPHGRSIVQVAIKILELRKLLSEMAFLPYDGPSDKPSFEEAISDLKRHPAFQGNPKFSEIFSMLDLGSQLMQMKELMGAAAEMRQESSTGQEDFGNDGKPSGFNADFLSSFLPGNEQDLLKTFLSLSNTDNETKQF